VVATASPTATRPNDHEWSDLPFFGTQRRQQAGEERPRVRLHGARR
jgi:hypothetical protein